MKLIPTLLLTTALGLSAPASADELQSLRNMERERAALIETLLDPDLGAEVRQTRVLSLQNRLVDLERIVLRDDRLLGHDDRLVRLTFKDYDLSFLVHAGAEAQRATVEHWLDQVGLSGAAVLSARLGRR